MTTPFDYLRDLSCASSTEVGQSGWCEPCGRRHVGANKDRSRHRLRNFYGHECAVLFHSALSSGFASAGPKSDLEMALLDSLLEITL